MFTDGCTSEYKSRRITRAAVYLADFDSHMFAPSSAFKTMVDGQGLIPKNKNTEMKADVAKTLGLFSYMFVEKDLRKPERIY